MNIKPVFFFLFMFLSCGANAQYKVYSYNQVQTRNAIQQWGKSQNICNQKAEFTAREINLNIDESYHLTIVSKTDLPENGTIYLCKDEKSNPITVMLIDDIKMYLYAKTKRFLINFQAPAKLNQLADTD